MDRDILSEDEVIPQNQIQRAESTKDSTDTIYNFILINNLHQTCETDISAAPLNGRLR